MPQALVPAGFVPAAALAFGQFGSEATPVADASPLPTYSPGGLMTAVAATTRPADTTAYAVGDLVANTTVAATVVPVELANVTRAAGEAVRIERVRLTKTSATLLAASFRVHLFRRPPVVTAGDNALFDSGGGVLSLTEIAGYVGSADIVMDRAAAGATGIGLPNGGGGITVTTGSTAGKERSIWALIEARAMYGPASAETFTVLVEGARS